MIDLLQAIEERLSVKYAMVLKGETLAWADFATFLSYHFTRESFEEAIDAWKRTRVPDLIAKCPNGGDCTYCKALREENVDSSGDLIEEEEIEDD